MINAFSFELCFTVAILSALFIYVLLYRKEDDLDSYRFEYIRNQLSDEEVSRIDGLNEKEELRMKFILMILRTNNYQNVEIM